MFDDVKKIGRTFENDGILWLSFSGTGIEFSCVGALKIELVRDMVDTLEDAPIHYARYAVFVDGILREDSRLEEERKCLCYNEEGYHSYRLIKLSESADSSLGISSIEGKLAELELKNPMRFEIIGDSITCGYGVEGDLTETYTTATENVMKAWSYLTAARFGADYSIISKSGSGIISGYTGDGVRNLSNIIVDYYDKCGCSAAGVTAALKPSAVEYEFAFDPDVILVNIGTNDISYCLPVDYETGKFRISDEEINSRKQLFTSEYVRFLTHIRDRNPRAKILCILGIMGTGLNAAAEAAVEERVKMGDDKIHFLGVAEQLEEDGRGTDYHPSAITQKKLAELVYDEILSIL